MADSTVKTVLTLSAYDRMSFAVDKAVNKSIQSLYRFKQSADKIASKGLSLQNAGAAVLGSQVLQQPIQAFANLEEGATRLKSVMMSFSGVPTQTFEKINKVAIDLGNNLPGATNDFYNMFAEMIQGGLTAENIINGTGKAAAYLAVQLKLPYEEIGRGVAKLKEATGVADSDMMKFMDTIQRTANVGVKFDEMQIAFARSSGQLKFLGLQGLEASKDVSTLYAMLIKSGATGETVGTGMANAMAAVFDTKKMAMANAEAAKFGVSLNFLDKQGNFKGVENFIGQFGKLKGLSQQQISKILTPIFGATGQDVGFIKTIATGGLPAFRKMQEEMKKQADLEARVALQLATLTNIWESLTGTFTNFLATVGGSVAPALKQLSIFLNGVTTSASEFLEKHKVLSQILGWSIGIVGGLAVAAGGLGITLGLIAKAVSFSSTGFIMLGKAIAWMNMKAWYSITIKKSLIIWTKLAAAAQWLYNTSLYGCPIIWIIAGLMAVIAAVWLVVKYWQPITAFFGKVWEGIKGVFKRFNEWFKGWGKWIIIPLLPFIGIPLLIINNWGKIKSFFSGLWKFFISLGSKFFDAGKNIVKSIYEGIKAFASKPIEAFKNIVQRIRNFLPFSPAKDGPFRDLHRVKIIETIAATMKPAPMLKAMNMTMNAIAGQGTGSSFQAKNNSGGMVYAPVINISGSATTRDKEDFQRILRENADYMFRLMNEKVKRNNHLTY